MITIEKLITKLNQYPRDARCYAYEGEDTGLTVEIIDNETKAIDYDFIRCTPKDIED